MAAWLNKWLLLSALPATFYISGSGIGGRGLKYNITHHPFHVSVVEINHNKDDKNLEISCKLFTDDFEKVLVKNYKTKIDLINPPDRKAMDKLVNDYISKRLYISINGKPVDLSYLGFEREDDAIYVYIEGLNITSVNKVEITNSLMHDLYDDQTNLLHVIVGGERKSTKLEYPNKQAVVEF